MVDEVPTNAGEVPTNAGEVLTATEVEKKISKDVKIEINPIDEAKKVVEESKKILEETKKERLRIEKATAEMLINGRSYAGQPTIPQVTPEQKATADRIKALGEATGADWAKDKI